MTSTRLMRRRALALLGSSAISPASTLLGIPLSASAQQGLPNAAAASPAARVEAGAPPAIRTDVLTVLYRKHTDEALPRQSTAVQAAIQALESEFLRAGLRLVQPDARTYGLLDQGPSVVVNFAADAGFSLLFSLQTALISQPGSDLAIAKVHLQARVFVGRGILSSEVAEGSMGVNLAPANREFGERRSLELAATDAAKRLAGKLAPKLRELSAERIQALVSALPQGAAVERPMVIAPEPAVADPMQPLPPPAQRFALLVCVSDYAQVRRQLKDPRQPKDLPGVRRDMANLNASLGKLGFAPGNIRQLADAQATSGAVRQQLKEMVRQAGVNDLVLIAVSAHGVNKDYSPSGFGAPVLSDYTGAAGGDPIDFWELQSLVSNLPARRVVLVIDTCHSGGATGLMSNAVITGQGVTATTGPVSPDPNAMVRAARENEALAHRHIAILTASQANELSVEDPIRGGLFTSRLLQALVESKGQLPLEQVFKERVFKQVVDASVPLCKQSGDCKVQTPMFAYSGRGNMIRL